MTSGPEQKSKSGLDRRAFLQGTSLLALGYLLGCTSETSLLKPERVTPFDLSDDYLEKLARFLPKEAGKTRWTGEWTVVDGFGGKAKVRPYRDQNGNLRHEILLIEIPTVNLNYEPLTPEQKKALFRKEVYLLYSFEFIDGFLASKIDLRAYPLEEIHVLADGLSVLALSADDQKRLNFSYPDPFYQYFSEGHEKAGEPYYPDLNNRGQSVLKEGEYIVWDRQSLGYKELAAIGILSTRIGSINPDGLTKLGPALMTLIRELPTGRLERNFRD